MLFTYRPKVIQTINPPPRYLPRYAGDTELSLALSASVPIAPIPVPLKAGVSNAWQSNHSGGCFRSGYQHNDCFTVLFDLKSCTKSKWGLFRDSREPDLDGVDG